MKWVRYINSKFLPCFDLLRPSPQRKIVYIPTKRQMVILLVQKITLYFWLINHPNLYIKRMFLTSVFWFSIFSDISSVYTIISYNYHEFTIFLLSGKANAGETCMYLPLSRSSLKYKKLLFIGVVMM